jgi:hypothetical protein
MHRRPPRPWLAKSTKLATNLARRCRQALRDVILDVTGLSAFVVAMFHLPGFVGQVAGYAAVGLACFVLRWGLGDGKSS